MGAFCGARLTLTRRDEHFPGYRIPRLKSCHHYRLSQDLSNETIPVLQHLEISASAETQRHKKGRGSGRQRRPPVSPTTPRPPRASPCLVRQSCGTW